MKTKPLVLTLSTSFLVLCASLAFATDKKAPPPQIKCPTLQQLHELAAKLTVKNVYREAQLGNPYDVEIGQSIAPNTPQGYDSSWGVYGVASWKRGAVSTEPHVYNLALATAKKTLLEVGKQNMVYAKQDDFGKSYYCSYSPTNYSPTAYARQPTVFVSYQKIPLAPQ